MDAANYGSEGSDRSSKASDVEGHINADAEVSELVKTLKRRSLSDPFSTGDNSSLDPDSKNFRAHDWVKAMLQHNEAGNGTPGRTAGIAFRNLNVHGFGSATDYQKDVGNVWLDFVNLFKRGLGLAKPRRIDILRNLEGVVRAGEMLVVLGPPGSGCSTFLKTITGETYGFNVDESSHINYQGIPPKKMHRYFRGEAIYTAEVDEHIPILSVGDTLTVAARARTPKKVPGGMSRNEWADHLRDVVMAAFGISHIKDTRVGDELIRGVSGGERKRVTIAEAALSGAPLQAWDNSTRGLDSANAIEFCKTLHLSSELAGTTACVAIYQAPQAAFDVFDKALVLYEGRQIYFGSSTSAQSYFERLGFVCPERQTSADFLTSMTSPQERVVREGYETRVPRTPDEFAAAWQASAERVQVLKEVEEFDKEYPFEGESYDRFVASRRAQQAKLQRLKSPYTLSYGQQISLCLWRGIQRVKADPNVTISMIVGCAIQGLIMGSIFYNLPDNTSSFFPRGSIVYFALLLNAFGSVLEILTIYSQRRTVEKHARYAFYHPSAEAIASMLTELPLKVINSLVMSTIIYLLVQLRQTPGAFFFFWFICFILIVTTSMIFRCIGSLSRTFPEAMVPAALTIETMVVFTGFAIPRPYMPSWCRWISYIDPVSYGFESLMVNEFYGREFACSAFVPNYGDLSRREQVCNSVGSSPGSTSVDGTSYIGSAFHYYHGHKYTNVPIIFALMVFFMCCYLIATELVSSRKSKGELLVFRRGHTPAALTEKKADDEAAYDGVGGAQIAKEQRDHTQASDVIQKQTAIFTWRNVCYDIKIKKEERRILDHVDGWVKPGTLTALMGVSGAGKTTLLDVLATRVTMGVIRGDIAVDGQQRDSSFQRKTGYVQQQDLHLQTATVREALNFSALLRQPASTPRSEKLKYVDEVIKMLDMEEYAEAVVGVPGEGLNVEQRKRLTIGVELAAKPALLLFLDEPTSGLDSQTSWAILDLLEKLKRSGQAILCTIHQPNAMLFQRFDQLLFLAAGGKTVYFGEMGPQSRTVTNYFEANGAPPCPVDANPAEWMLHVIGAAPGSHTDIDWFKTWRRSREYLEVHKEIEHIMRERPQIANPSDEDKEGYREFAAPLTTQIKEVTYRVFQQYWRSPSYIYSKIALGTLAALYTGFIFFKAPLSRQGLQNQMFAIFAILALYPQLLEQILPHFVSQRALYEARERPSKAYSWKAFMLANICVELPWNALVGIIMFFCFYYPVGLYNNAVPTNSVTLRGAQFFLFTLQFPIFLATFTQMVIAGLPDAETAANVGNLLIAFALMFCGILQPPSALPGFWTFMYRASPYTYFVGGMLGSGLANQEITCATNEFLHFQPRANETCAEYMQPYIHATEGYLSNPSARADCEFCPYGSTNTFLASVGINYGNVWRDYGILWVFVGFNILAAVTIYWLARVPKKATRVREEKAGLDMKGASGSDAHPRLEEKL